MQLIEPKAYVELSARKTAFLGVQEEGTSSIATTKPYINQTFKLDAANLVQLQANFLSKFIAPSFTLKSLIGPTLGELLLLILSV